MRFHTQTAGVSLTAQQPLNNIARTAIEALAGVLGGTQSLHTNSHDEALALPSEEAVRVALRTQQVIAHETGVTNTADPLGGAYFVEALTDEMERLAYEYFGKIDELGGMVEAVKRGFPQREIADAAFVLQQEYDSGARTLVGVNAFTEGGDGELEILRIDPALERKQVGRVQAVRARRDGAAVDGRAGASPRRRGARGQPDARAARRGACPCERGRDRRGAAVGVGELHRDAGVLSDARAGLDRRRHRRLLGFAVPADRREPPVREPLPLLDHRALILGRAAYRTAEDRESDQTGAGARSAARTTSARQLVGGVDRDRLVEQVLLDRGRAVLTADAGLLVAAERRVEVRRVGVDRVRAGPHAARDLEAARGIGREHAAGQAEAAVVRDADRVLVVVERDEGDDRAEDLLLGDRHVVAHVRQQRRLDVPALVQVLRHLAAGGDRRALVDGLLDVAEHPLAVRLGDQRADDRVVLVRVADLQRLRRPP